MRLVICLVGFSEIGEHSFEMDPTFNSRGVGSVFWGRIKALNYANHLIEKSFNLISLCVRALSNSIEPSLFHS